MVRPHLGGVSLPAILLAGLLSGCSPFGQSSEAAVHAPNLVQEGSLTVCTSAPYEPFEFEKDGQMTGFDIDLADAVAERLKLQPVYLNKDFDALASGQLLNANTCDLVIAGLSITGDRARSLDFSSPYFNAAQAMVVKKTDTFTTLDSLAGHKIAVQTGSTGETYVTDHAPATAEVVNFAEPGAMAEAVAHGLIAAAVYDNTVVGDILADQPDLKLVTQFDTGEQYGMAVQKNGNVELLRVVNDVIATLKSDGGYDKIYNKWFGAS